MATLKSIRPLTLIEKRRPAQLVTQGGFKNISFQIGEVLIPNVEEDASVQSIPSTRKGILKKTDTVQFPICVPSSVTVFKGVNNQICTVMGKKNKDGLYDAYLVARSCERLSSFNVKLRSIEDLTKVASELEPVESDRIGKGYMARAHNQVSLCGVVVGSWLEDGDFPRFHILLRQDSNPDNLIPLVYESKNASSQISRVKYGSIIYVEGEYAYRKSPVPQVNEDGRVSLDADRNVIYRKDEEGNDLVRLNAYIKITAPKDPNLEYDTNFGENFPKWAIDLAAEMEARRKRTLEKAA